MSASMSNCRLFNFGNRSVPPATNMARGPSSVAMCAASRAVFGRRYLNRGSRSTTDLQRFRWRLDFDAGGVGDRWKAHRSEAWRITFLFAAQGLDYLLWRHRNLVDPDAKRVEHRRADGGDDREQRALPRLFRAIRSFGIDGLDDEGLDLGHVHKRRRFVFEHRRPLVQDFAISLLFHVRLAESHVHAALDLAFHEQRVDRAAHVVGDPHLVEVHDAAARVRVQVDDACRVAVRGAWADARTLVRTGDLWRRVAAGAGQRPKASLGEATRLLEAEIADPAVGDGHRIRCRARLYRNGFDEHAAHLSRRLEGGIAGHERDAGRVGAEVDWRGVGVGSDQTDVSRLDAELFGDDRREHRVGALTDVHRAAERGDAATVELDLYLRVRHVVPVDRGAGAREVARDRETEAVAGSPLAIAVSRCADHSLCAFVEATRCHAEPVDSAGHGLDEVGLFQVDGVESDVVRDLLEVQLERETGLRGAVASLGTARWLVGEDAAAFEAISRDVVGHRLKSACIKGRGDAVRAIGAPIEGGLEMHRRDVSVFRDACPHPHQHRVATSVRVEDLFAGQRAFDRTAGQHRQLADDDLVRERVGLATEPAAVRRADDADPAHRQLEHFREGPVHVVDHLRRGPQGDASIDEGGDRAVLLHRQVGVALEEEDVLADMVRLLKSPVHVAELERDQLVDIVWAAVILDALVLDVRQRLVDRHHRLEDFVLD